MSDHITLPVSRSFVDHEIDHYENVLFIVFGDEFRCSIVLMSL